MQLTHDPDPSQKNVDYGVDVKGSREVTPSRADTLQPKSANKHQNDNDVVKVRSSYRDAKSTFMHNSPFKQSFLKAEDR